MPSSIRREAMSEKVNRRYVSDLDKMLCQWDKDHPEPSVSQQDEIKKHRAVFSARDHACERDEGGLWR
jgi:hypothetical protein